MVDGWLVSYLVSRLDVCMVLWLVSWILCLIVVGCWLLVHSFVRQFVSNYLLI